MEPTPTTMLDWNNDRVYDSTTSVVWAVKALSQGVQAYQANLYLDLVKKVGLELRELLAAVDRLIPAFPSNTHIQVELAHKVLSKDMSELINTMKLAQEYNNTTVEGPGAGQTAQTGPGPGNSGSAATTEGSGLRRAGSWRRGRRALVITRQRSCDNNL